MAEETDFPEGVFSIIGASREVSAHLVSHPQIDKVSLTGEFGCWPRSHGDVRSAPCERHVGARRQVASNHADGIPLDRVLPSLIPGFINYQGQICAALTRVIVRHDRYDEVRDAVSGELARIAVEDPTDPTVDQGPLASRRQARAR